MPTSSLSIRSGGADRRKVPRAYTVLAAVLVCVLPAVLLALAFCRGAYVPADWLPLVVLVAALAAVVLGFGPGVRFSRWQWLVLGAFILQAGWTALSLLWAASVNNAWEEANRTFFYLLAVGLAAVAVRVGGPRALRWLGLGVLGAVAVMAAVIIARLDVAGNPLRFFVGGRLNYPVTYWNGLAALLMVGFWLALGQANRWGVASRSSHRGWACYWAPPLLLAVAVVLVELALLPQSRGALWTLFLVVPFFIIFSPHRFRALTHLVIVAIPVALFWDRINGVYAAAREIARQGAAGAGPAAASGAAGAEVVSVPEAAFAQAVDSCLAALFFSALIVIVLWGVSYLLEVLLARGGIPGRRSRVYIGVALLVVALGVVAAGLVAADRQTGGLGSYVGEKWQEFTGDRGTSESGGSRFSEVSLNGRLTQWKVALTAFQERPLLGLGAQNFHTYWYEHRPISLTVKQPHSQPVQLLAELGLPGLVFYLVFFVGVMVLGVLLRFRAGKRENQAVVAAMLTACLAWFIHSSADWLWQLGAVTFPVMLLLGGLLGAGTGRRQRSRPEVAAAVLAAPEAAGAPVAPAGRLLGRHWGWAGRAIAVIACLAILVSAAVPYVALRFEDKALENAAVDQETALAGAGIAARLNPVAASPWMIQARVASLAGGAGTDALVAALREAVDREPSDWTVAYNAALLVVKQRDEYGGSPAYSREALTEIARQYLERARDLNPLESRIERALKEL